MLIISFKVVVMFYLLLCGCDLVSMIIWIDLCNSAVIVSNILIDVVCLIVNYDLHFVLLVLGGWVLGVLCCLFVYVLVAAFYFVLWVYGLCCFTCFVLLVCEMCFLFVRLWFVDVVVRLRLCFCC